MGENDLKERSANEKPPPRKEKRKLLSKSETVTEGNASGRNRHWGASRPKKKKELLTGKKGVGDKGRNRGQTKHPKGENKTAKEHASKEEKSLKELESYEEKNHRKKMERGESRVQQMGILIVKEEVEKSRGGKKKGISTGWTKNTPRIGEQGYETED